MADYAEDQANEIEALESIYPDEITIVEVEPFHKFDIAVTATHSDWDCEDESANLVIQFTYTEKYPDEFPVMEITESENLEEDEEAIIIDFMQEQAEENVGMVMVFTIVAAVQEKLQTLLEKRVTTAKEAKLAEIKAKEEAERKRFIGTEVTIETFLAWKAKFDAEMAELKKQRGEIVKVNTKLTGKELFFSDTTLDDSDVKFLEEDGGDTVAVDESLFQDLDDLDLDDDSDDPDYMPGS